MGSDEKLPSSFDVVVFGTGLPEAMVAAALSRVGKKVLHLDRNDYYGAQWATFNFESLLQWIEKYETNVPTIHSAETIPTFDSCVKNIVVRSYIPETNTNVFVSENEHENKHENEGGVGNNDTKSDKTQTGKNDEIVKGKNKDGDFSNDLNTHKINVDGIVEGDNVKSDNCEGEYAKTHEPEEDSNSNFQKKDSTEETVETVNQLSPSIVSQAKIMQGSKDISVEDFKILSRKFNLDITSKFLFSAGPLVNAILKANISHYAEFKVVNRILMCKDDEIIEVPCNRSDVFSSNFLSVIEKRMLMKFLTFCLEYDADSEEVKDFVGKSFQEFLKSRRISENLQKFVIYSIAMVKPDTVTETALLETQTFLKSLGHYGKSPFIWPLFGTGELPQAFCRMSAVFGGIYYLHKDVKELHFDDIKNDATVIISDQSIDCKHVVMEKSYVPTTFVTVAGVCGMVSKAILITSCSLIPSEEECVSFLTIPPLIGREELVRVVEIGPASSACPTGLFVLYLTCTTTTDALEDLEEYVKLLTKQNHVEDENTRPILLWSVYFNQETDVTYPDIPKNMHVTSMPGPSLGFAQTVEEAEKIFKSICPNKEFMLSVPNPEDIIWDNDQGQAVDSNGIDTNEEENESQQDECNVEESEKENDASKESEQVNIVTKDNKGG